MLNGLVSASKRDLYRKQKIISECDLMGRNILEQFRLFAFTSCLCLVMALALLPVLQLLSVPVFAQGKGLRTEETKSKLEEAERNLQSAQEKENEFSRDIKFLRKERARLNKLLIETARRIQKGESALSKIEGSLGKLLEQEKVIRGSIKKRHGTLSQLLAIMQRMGRQPPPVMATQRDDALKMVRSAMLLTSLFPELLSQADKLTGELTKLVRIATNIKNEAEALRKENSVLANERVRIKTLLATKKIRIVTNRKSLKSIQAAAKKYARSVNSLGELISKLDREVKKTAAFRAHEAELAMKKAAGELDKVIETAPKTKTAVLIKPDRIKPLRPFRKTKGQLHMPVSGQKLTSYGKQDSFGRKAAGITIKTRENAQIISPNDGWVVYAGPFRSYGQLLIINAGGGYHVLLAGMKHIDVSMGQFVLSGEPIATMGALGPQNQVGGEDTSPVLYVEFRKDGRPIDPDPWWSDTQEKAQG